MFTRHTGMLTMPQDVKEWIDRYIAARRRRLNAGTALTNEMLRRSHEQIARSHELLNNQIPRVWHPEAPEGF
jgi:hypothetical protein